MKATSVFLAALGISISLADASAVKRAPRRAKRQSTTLTNSYSGVALKPSPDGTAFSYITAQINVPQTLYVSSESQPPTVQKAAAWVGFGPATPGGAGGSGTSGIMQTGCVFKNDGQQDAYTQCWVEFYPNPPQFFSGFSPAVGDTLLLELTRNSATQGTAKITNLANSGAVSSTFSAPSGHSITGQNAEWIVENPAGAATFVDFQKEFFEGCQVTTSGGNTYGPGDGTYVIYNENKDGAQWTNSFLPSDSEVEVDWQGPSGTS